MSLQSTFRVWAAALAVAAPLAACGKMGQLERPGPLFGKAPTAAESKEIREVNRQDVPPIETIDRRDPYSDLDLPPLPERVAPIEGTYGPNALPPPGALPNPYATPPR
jgi:predicted small lipoprotein YifL